MLCLAEADADEHIQVQAQLLGVEQGNVLPDQAPRLQRADARQARRR